jgi:hypothetical protein
LQPEQNLVSLPHRPYALATLTTVVFHVTSTANRESIRHHGLDWRRMGATHGVAGDDSPEAEGVFLARDWDEAKWFVRISRSHHESVDIWEVRLPDDFDVDEPPPADLPYAELDGHLYTTRAIGPDRIRLRAADV